jgi:hypothetical protein
MVSGAMIYECIPSFIKIDSGIHAQTHQAILKVYLRNLTCCNVGVTDGSNLSSSPLKWTQVVGYAYEVPGRSVQAFK